MSIVYVSCAGDGAIYVLALDASGGLSRLGVTQVPSPPGEATSMALALSPDGTRLYAGVRLPPHPVSCFAVEPQGGLRWLGSADMPSSAAYIDLAGPHLLGASYHDGVLMRLALGADGVPTGPAQVLPTPPKAHSVIADPAGRWIYAACLGGDVILRLELSDGALVLRDETHVHPGAGPRHLRFGRDGRFLYAINELDASLDVFAVADGALRPVQTLKLVPDATPRPRAAADIHLTPDGSRLVASERRTDTLTLFRVEPSGTLTQIDQVPSEPSPRGFAIDPSGRFLLCAGQTSNRVAVYALADRLERLGAIDVGANPNWLTFAKDQAA